MTDATSGTGTATLPEHMSSPPDLSGVCVARTFVYVYCFVDRCLLCCLLFFHLRPIRIR
jgi:hypothetical protein